MKTTELALIALLTVPVGCGIRPHDDTAPTPVSSPTQLPEQQPGKVDSQGLRPTEYQAVNEVGGELRGYDLVNTTIRERFMAGNVIFDISAYLGDRNIFGGGLIDLLGVWTGTGVDAGFRNGSPNAVNMMLYQMVFKALGNDISQVCSQPDRNHASWKVLTPALQNSLSAVCGWPNDAAQSDPAMNGLWNAVMAFDAPIEEREAWKEFFRSQYGARLGLETVSHMIYAMLTNPHFLLKK